MIDDEQLMGEEGKVTCLHVLQPVLVLRWETRLDLDDDDDCSMV